MPHLGATDSLEDAVQALASSNDEGLPVIDEHDQLIGWITRRRVLRIYLKRFGTPYATNTDAPPTPPKTNRP